MDLIDLSRMNLKLSSRDDQLLAKLRLNSHERKAPGGGGGLGARSLLGAVVWRRKKQQSFNWERLIMFLQKICPSSKQNGSEEVT